MGATTDVLYCDGYPYITDTMDYTLTSIFLKAWAIYCYSCDYSGLETEVVSYNSNIGLYIAECSDSTSLCTYTQYYNTKTGACTDCSSVYPNCAHCNSTTCLFCIENFYWNPSFYDYSK